MRLWKEWTDDKRNDVYAVVVETDQAHAIGEAQKLDAKIYYAKFFWERRALLPP
jgi:hypothetical protein